MYDDHHDDEHERRDERGRDDDRERRDGRIRKGEVRNPYGRAGKPATRAQRERRRNEGMKELLVRELRRLVEVSDRGRREEITLLEWLVKKLIQDLANAPVKQRLQLVFDPRSPLRDLLEALPDDGDDNDPWTEDLEAEYQAIAQRYVILEDRRDPYRPSDERDRSRAPRDDAPDWPKDYMKGPDEPDEARAPERGRERDRDRDKDEDQRREPRRR